MMNIHETDNEKVGPFLKWAGGKRWLVRSDSQISPLVYKKYFEPFIGGGAVFFSMNHNSFLIADANVELVNCYNAIRSDFQAVKSSLAIHHRKHSFDYYYKIRASQPSTSHTRAAKFIYLNRTCYNGLYRVNRKGGFNVPKGTTEKVILESDDFGRVSKKLQNGKILHQDFEQTISMANDGDFIFIDPPYTVKHNMNGFVSYNEKIFSWEDQERLKTSIVEAVKRGVMVTLTNADHSSIRELYDGLCEIQSVSRSSLIAGRAKNRGKTTEVIMRFGWDIN